MCLHDFVKSHSNYIKSLFKSFELSSILRFHCLAKTFSFKSSLQTKHSKKIMQELVHLNGQNKTFLITILRQVRTDSPFSVLQWWLWGNPTYLNLIKVVWSNIIYSQSAIFKCVRVYLLLNVTINDIKLYIQRHIDEQAFSHTIYISWDSLTRQSKHLPGATLFTVIPRKRPISVAF